MGISCQRHSKSSIDFFNSVNHEQVQVSIYFYFLLLGLNLQMISPTCTFQPTALFTVPCVLLNNSDWIFGTYKSDVSFKLWDTTYYSHVRFFTLTHIGILKKLFFKENPLKPASVSWNDFYTSNICMNLDPEFSSYQWTPTGITIAQFIRWKLIVTFWADKT